MIAFFVKIWTFVNKYPVISGIVAAVVSGWILCHIQTKEEVPEKNVKTEVFEPKASRNFQLSPVVKTLPEPQPGDVQTITFPEDVKLEKVYYPAGRFSEKNVKTEVSEPKASRNFQLFPVVETPKAGDVKTFTLSPGVELEMVWCPGGRFTMGSPDGKSEYPLGSGVDPKAELGRWSDEPPHEVTLTKGFWIGQYPVTQAQYKAITGENPANFNGNTRPVEMVSWHDSVAFCEKLNQLKIAPAGYKFALPTEAQWEYACRAGRATALNSGKSLTTKDGKCPNLDEVGWYGKNSGKETHPVGEKQPNAWGIYDMHGNVWEWCRDCCVWGYSEQEIITDTYKDEVVDPVCSEGGNRVLRGGSWRNDARGCRSANRYNFAPGSRYGSFGFRLALIPE